jgi:acyl-CoA synthetase (AMP-forming)/AMP-acid ligase II
VTPICTIRQLLNVGADDAIAIQASSRANLTYADLRSLADSTLEALNAAGIGRNDRVAIVLPNGPEMATAFMTIACAATTAPLNPSYRQEEFEFYIDDLKSVGR